MPSLKDAERAEVEFVDTPFEEGEDEALEGAGGAEEAPDRGEKGDKDFHLEEEIEAVAQQYSDEDFESDDGVGFA